MGYYFFSVRYFIPTFTDEIFKILYFFSNTRNFALLDLLFTSSSYTRGRQLYSLYSSSKAAIVNFVQALSEEWQDSGIRINCINPERTKTPMRERNFGIEPEDTLLKSSVVASVSVNTIFSSLTGEVVDVKKRP